MSREPARQRSLQVVDGTFYCDGCHRRRAEALHTETGFCARCITRGHKFWLGRLSLEELQDLAHQIWPDLNRPDAAQAA